MKNNTYLTLDLDYWDRRCDWTKRSTQSLALIKRILRLHCPITLYLTHAMVLQKDLKNSHGFQSVVNIDFHDDIVSPGDEKNSLMDACWVNYVPSNEKMSYTWMYPSDICTKDKLGLCSGTGEYVWPMLNTTWKYIHRVKGLKNIPWRDITKVSVILTPDYTCPMYVMSAIELLLKTKRVVRSKEVVTVVQEWRNLLPW